MIFGTPPIVTNGLVLNLDAGNTKSYPRSGTVWRDLSGFNNSGSLVNGPTYSSDAGGNISFDGVDDYFTSPQFSIPTNNRTFEVCIRFNTSGSSGNFMPILIQTSAYDNTSSVRVTGLQKISGNFTIIQPVANGTNFNAYSAGFNYQSLLGQWIHVVGTVEGGSSSKIYLNTNLVSNVAITVNPEQVSRFITSGYFTGPQYNMAVARVYDRALSISEIQQNYNALKSRFNL